MDEIDAIIRRLSNERFDKLGDGQELLLADEWRITSLESTIGCQLPPDYRAFLPRYGGTYLLNTVAELHGCDVRLEPDTEFAVSFFLAFYSNVPKSVSHDINWRYTLRREELTPGMVPFADGGPCDYYISCQEGTYGQIYWWLPEGYREEDEDEEGEVDPWSGLYYIAPSFMDFLRSLRTLSEQEVEDRYS